MIVVGVQPVGQGGAALGFGSVAPGVGPFIGEGAVEAFHFAVGLGPVGAGAPGRDGELVACGGPVADLGVGKPGGVVQRGVQVADRWRVVVALGCGVILCTNYKPRTSENQRRAETCRL